MRLFNITAAAALAGSATATPTPQVDDPKPPFGVAFTYLNGTFTGVLPVPDSLAVYPLSKVP